MVLVVVVVVVAVAVVGDGEARGGRVVREAVEPRGVRVGGEPGVVRRDEGREWGQVRAHHAQADQQALHQGGAAASEGVQQQAPARHPEQGHHHARRRRLQPREVRVEPGGVGGNALRGLREAVAPLGLQRLCERRGSRRVTGAGDDRSEGSACGGGGGGGGTDGGGGGEGASHCQACTRRYKKKLGNHTLSSNKIKKVRKSRLLARNPI